ncbi:hypothetical protein [Corallococcus llansteffanensis]|nr:hypothetical protein [Corallococcus llansteffanensis]
MRVPFGPPSGLVRGLAPPPIVYKRNFLVRGDALNMEEHVTT